MPGLDHRVRRHPDHLVVLQNTTSVLTRADFLSELDALPTVGPDIAAPGVECCRGVRHCWW